MQLVYILWVTNSSEVLKYSNMIYTCTRDPNLLITMPADVQAYNGCRPIADVVLNMKLVTVKSQKNGSHLQNAFWNAFWCSIYSKPSLLQALAWPRCLYAVTFDSFIRHSPNAYAKSHCHFIHIEVNMWWQNDLMIINVQILSILLS